MNSFESEQIKHQIYFESYKNGRAAKIAALLDDTVKQLAKYLKQYKGVNTKARYAEIRRKIQELAKALKTNVSENTDIDAVIDYELKKQTKLLDELKKSVLKTKNADINFLFPSAEQVKTAALFAPVTGNMTFQSYLDSIEEGLFNVWDSQVRTGYLTGMTTDEIVRRVVGKAAASAKVAEPGMIDALRRSVYSNTRTVLQSFANTTRQEVFKKNEKYFGTEDGYKYEFLATLDRRTCPVCGSYDGKRFKKLEDAPEIPVHRNCRCMVIPAVDIEGGTRASADGYVSSKVTYEEWLKGQSEDVQREVLGATRYKLFKAGKKISSFVDNGKTLTIKELMRTVSPETLKKAEIAIREKQSGFVTGYRRKTAEEKQQAVEDWLLRKGKKSGVERLVLTSSVADGNNTDDYTGRILSIKKGRKSSVVFGAREKDVVYHRPENSVVLTHNHPSGDSFSSADINIAIQLPSIKRIVAVGHNGTSYYLEIGNGIRVDSDVLEREYNNLDSKYKNSHKIVTILADRYKWIYDIKKR